MDSIPIPNTMPTPTPRLPDFYFLMHARRLGLGPCPVDLPKWGFAHGEEKQRGVLAMGGKGLAIQPGRAASFG